MDLEKYMLPCLVKKYSGMDCPGCGMQRSFALLIEGDFSAAFNMFPAIYTTVLFFGVLGLHFADKSRNYHKAIIGLAIANAVIVLVAFICKIFNY